MDNLTVDTVMAYLLFGLVQFLVLAAIGVMIFFLYSVITRGSDPVEKLLRVAAFGAGLLVYVGAQALGMSIPELMGSALSVADPLGFSFLDIVFPGLAGTFVAWFCLRLMRKDDDVAARGLVLFSAFVFTMFADTYVNLAPQAVTSTSVNLMIPNITFVLGVVLYTIFKYKPRATEQGGRGQGMPEMGRRLGRTFQELGARLNIRASTNDKDVSEEKRQEPHEQSVVQEKDVRDL